MDGIRDSRFPGIPPAANPATPATGDNSHSCNANTLQTGCARLHCVAPALSLTVSTSDRMVCFDVALKREAVMTLYEEELLGTEF